MKFSVSLIIFGMLAMAGQFGCQYYQQQDVQQQQSEEQSEHKSDPLSGVQTEPETAATEVKKLGGMSFVWCPPGTFQMGSPETEKDRKGNEKQVEVTLSQGFWMGKTEVTQSQWQKVMGTAPWKKTTGGQKGENFPAYNVSWDDAIEFCQKFTEQGHNEGWLPEEQEIRLPTEAQWEYACRAGTTTRFFYGDDIEYTQLNKYAWFEENASFKDEGYAQQYAQQVGQKEPNPWNLSDVHGNLSEWCQDAYADELPGGTDPEVHGGQGSNRVIRGGCWSNAARNLRSAYRGMWKPSDWDYGLGFRCMSSTRSPSS